ncbi:MAG: site-2 protease family protein [Lachnospiraceae bacterium]|nr:site-2 protease family protein [Lachnospiraceae bacterium]
MIMALLVLSMIVLFHELGHFLLARANGIAVLEFSLGFGPRLLSWKSKKSGTRYSVKCIPFGGSCAMLGEFGDEPEYEELRQEFADGKHGVSFFEKPPLAKLSVIAAGPLFNFIMAFVLSIAVVSWSGCDVPEIAQVVEGCAAEQAGLQQGDIITKAGNRNIMITRDIILYMYVHGKQDMEVQFKRLNRENGTWETHSVVLDSDYYYYQNGRYLSGMNFYGNRPATESLFSVLKYSAAEVRYNILSVVDSLAMIGKGKVEKDDIAGPVRIVSMIDETVETVSPYGAVYVIMNVFNLMIMFSANLGVMNLLPFPALDGGRILFLGWELVTGKPLNSKFEIIVNMISMALLMAFMVFVIFNDLTLLF